MGGASHNSATFNHWNDERNVNVNRNDNDWNDNWLLAGRRNYLSLRTPALLRAFTFPYNLPVPASELLARILKRYGERRVLVRFKRPGLPKYHEQYLQSIKLAYRKPYPRLFFCWSKEGRGCNCLYAFNK